MINVQQIYFTAHTLQFITKSGPTHKTHFTLLLLSLLC